ncbi:hypothetical protein Moror_13032 [Moniliophthora roreri MCA 2997]|uniref:Uncharacterized protein n=2 Tax=Moniliophthora roreri TaxID=221103 RepID=V2YQ99_MONRO|nr:hypothetical protein Moror_13032 [Moniliophthora roreri MCA 2997]KAI3604846.1 hypothetical protein WG66_008335 [Moniliophthora roreri]
MAIAIISEANAVKMQTVIKDSNNGLDQLANLQNCNMHAPTPAKTWLPSSSLHLLQSMPQSEDPCKAKRSPSLGISATAYGNVSKKDSPNPRSQEPAQLCKSALLGAGTGPGDAGNMSGKAGDTGPTRPNLVHDLTSDHHEDRPTSSPNSGSAIADALSSAFTKNAAEPYPESAIGALKTRRNEFRDTYQHESSAALSTRSRQKLQQNQEFDEYLDVNVAPVSFGGTGAKVAGQEAEAEEVAELGGIIAAFNRRHIARSISDSKSTLSKSSTSYACSSESYTAAYLNRVSEWFGPEGADQAANIDNRPITIQPTPQIPRVVRPASLANPSDFADDDESSVNDTRSVTPTSAIVQIRTTDSLSSGEKREVGEMDVRYTKRQRMMASLSDMDEPEPVPSHTMFLERLLKGKTKSSEEKVEHVKSYLAALGRGEQTAISAEFEACRQEDKDAFLQTLYRLLTSSGPGVIAEDLNKSAAAVLEKYGLGD